MYRDKKVVVVMPAYNVAKTLRETHAEVLAQDIVDLIVIVDNKSHDETAAIAMTLPKTKVCLHDSNLGYGGSQKTCYKAALEAGADIIILVHPDYQYTPLLVPAMAALIASGLYHCVLGSRILGGRALKGGMPWWKYVSNRALTISENFLMGSHLSEFHTGYRAYSRHLLETIPFQRISDGYVFDNQFLAQVCWENYTIAEITCPTKYFDDMSSVNFKNSVIYGLGCLGTAIRYRLAKWGLAKPL
jgi:glycosyltransferase involved in cell wall biosynthesis